MQQGYAALNNANSKRYQTYETTTLKLVAVITGFEIIIILCKVRFVSE